MPSADQGFLQPTTTPRCPGLHCSTSAGIVPIFQTHYRLVTSHRILSKIPRGSCLSCFAPRDVPCPQRRALPPETYLCYRLRVFVPCPSPRAQPDTVGVTTLQNTLKLFCSCCSFLCESSELVSVSGGQCAHSDSF